MFSTVGDQGVFFAGGYPLEGLERLVSESDFALAIAEPDDIVDSRGTRAPTLRDNVLFELGRAGDADSGVHRNWHRFSRKALKLEFDGPPIRPLRTRPAQQRPVLHAAFSLS